MVEGGLTWTFSFFPQRVYNINHQAPDPNALKKKKKYRHNTNISLVTLFESLDPLTLFPRKLTCVFVLNTTPHWGSLCTL